MASIEKRGDGYRVRWRDIAGRQHSRPAPDRRTAERLQRDIERALALGRDWTPDAAPAGLVDLIDAYLADRLRIAAHATVARERAILGLMVAWLYDTTRARRLTVDLLSGDRVAAWHGWLLQARGVKQRSGAAYVGVAMAFWRWAAASETHGAGVPAPRMPTMPPAPLPERIPPPSLAACDLAIEAAARTGRAEWLRRVLVIMRYTGLRAVQAKGLRWDDVDLEARTIRIRPELGKSRQERRGRVVPMHSSLAVELAAWGRREGFLVEPAVRGPGPGRRMPEGAPRGRTDPRTLERIWREAGCDPRQPQHGVRKAVITHLASRGVPVHIIGELVGHETSITAAVYIDPAAMFQAMADAIATLPAVGRSGADMDASRARRVPAGAYGNA